MQQLPITNSVCSCNRAQHVGGATAIRRELLLTTHLCTGQPTCAHAPAPWPPHDGPTSPNPKPGFEVSGQHGPLSFPQGSRLLVISSAKQFLRACLWILWLPIAEAGRSGLSLLNPLTTGSCPPAHWHNMALQHGGEGQQRSTESPEPEGTSW